MSSGSSDHAEGKKRPERCLARIPVSVRAEEADTTVLNGATSVNLSHSGMYLKGRPAAAWRDRPPWVGMHLSLRFTLPEQQLVFRVSAEVVWANPRERDHAGANALGFGVRFLDPSPTLGDAIDTFMREFQHSVLVVDDEEPILQLLTSVLEAGYHVVAASSAGEALGLLAAQEFAVLIVDYLMPEVTGADLLEELNRRYPNLATTRIVLSAYADPEVIRRFINEGRVFHYFRKPVDIDELEQVVQAAADKYVLTVENERLNTELIKANERLARENKELRAQVSRSQELGLIVGQSPLIRKVLSRLVQVADYPTTVHIRGETGTGKELVAKAVHQASPRRGRPFVAFNCAGVPETLVQSTLFGHKKGAFTGAVGDRPGIFEEADGGTVFLDEVGDLSPAVQSSLLRVLQEGEVLPVGATRPKKLDVRVVSATHRDLEEDVETGRFRSDLFYRLVVYEIVLPALRERLEDLRLLAEHFLTRVCADFNKEVTGFSSAYLATLEAYDWPGNIRELENEIKRAVIRTPAGQAVQADHLTPRIVEPAPGSDPVRLYHGVPLPAAVRDTERQLIRHAMGQCGNRVPRAAKLLGLQVSTLRKKMKRLGLSDDPGP